MRSVVYSRVSQDRRKTGRSVAQQEKEAQAACVERGWQLVGTFTDENRSASRFARKPRPGFEQLLQFLRDGHADVLVLWEASRGDRDLERWAGLLRICRSNKVKIFIVSHDRVYDLSIPADWKTLASEGVDAAYESEKTKLRVERDMRDAAKLGRPHGKTLYGYRRIYDSATGALLGQEIDEVKGPVVKEIATRVSEGESCYAIAVHLNSRGIYAPRGGSWDLTQIRRVAVNPSYAAMRVHQGQVVGDANWPAIVETSVHNVCVARLSDPRRRTNRDTTLRHLLTGTGKCGVCGSGLRVQKNRNVFSYMCGEKFCVSCKISNLEQFIEALVLARMKRKDILELLTKPKAASVSSAATELSQLRERLDSFYSQAAEGKVSAAGLAKIEAKLLPRIGELEKAATPAVLPPMLKALAGPNPGKVWNGFSIGQRREVVGLLVDVQLMPTRRGARTFDPDRVRITWRSF